jgi:hypothetical protein
MLDFDAVLWDVQPNKTKKEDKANTDQLIALCFIFAPLTYIVVIEM